MFRHGLQMAAVILGVLAVFVLVSCSGSDKITNSGGGGTPAANAVNISGFAFSPGNLTVKAGTEVTWTNKDSAPHTVTSDDSKFASSGNLSQNQTYKITFATAGIYAYHCTIHPSMTGTVTVTP